MKRDTPVKRLGIYESDPANRMPYVKFCKSLNPLLIQTYASRVNPLSSDSLLGCFQLK